MAETNNLRKNGTSLEWSTSIIALRDSIASMDSSEIIDPIALVDYGRDICRTLASAEHYALVRVRNELGLEKLTIEEKKNKANYLLSKAELSRYLSVTLTLFLREELKF